MAHEHAIDATDSSKYSDTALLLPYLLHRSCHTLVGGPADDFLEVAVEDVVEVPLRALEVDADERESRLGEKIVDLLERPALGLDHKQQLVDPAEGRNTPVETQREPRVGERVPHVGEVVRDDERPQVEHGAGGGDSVGTQVRRVHLGGDDPGETGVGAEEAHVEDDTGEVEAESRGVGDGQLVRDADEDEAEEEARKHGVGPEPAAAVVHVQDGRDGAEQQCSAAD
ncbi:hypothetical protein KL929_002414 [Ogataea haglerorum]|nr:hypothetical protein KL913_003488 [Ogataea haglerorum]KAG7717022.1 hypothetical protein KL949_003618 [Ogataea haglerorum]KAG7748023.1 hypothetical protein KL912_002700 [Ogataea haglerorum]KAG7769537.1 hypothetical protein KL931_002783 [Ogataea haglerorum]KAG7797571.1 hypothetical protein KL929_002414 [Ogataea haglerorum]